MNRIAGIVLILSVLAAANPFVSFFSQQTLRVDYFHTGTWNQELISIDAFHQEGEWPGSRVNLVDRLDLGNHRFQVFDTASGQLIFSRGYNSIFQEWQSTAQARQGIYRTFHETVRFPLPLQPVLLCFETRNRLGDFERVAEISIDPQSTWINRERHSPVSGLHALIQNGDPAEKVDLVLLGDGYREEEMDKFHQDAERAVASLFAVQPYKRRQADFNVWVVDAPSTDSGIDEPRKNLWRSTALGASYNSLDSPRYVLTTDNRAVRDIAAAAPYDAIALVVNSPRYGGGGIYNQFAVSFTGFQAPNPEWWCDYVFVHEFGHAFAGLADEYYTSQVSYLDYYPKGVEPWEPNITALLDPNLVKWADLIDPGTPIPTPWKKTEYDSLSVRLQSLNPGYSEYADVVAEMQALLRDFSAKAGCFEGAGYISTGLYRSAVNCRMFSKSLVPFCLVCQQAIERVIDTLSR